MKRLLEAILFAADKPVSSVTLAQILSGSPEESVRDALAEMTREYEEAGRSFQLKEVGGGYLFFTHPAYEPWVRKLFKGRLTLRLSRSAMETVAIIAYRQPVIKQEIETIRGVNADGVLNTLLDRKLIRVLGHKEGMGRALLYGTTNEFLLYMGINDLADLPQMEEMKAILEAREIPAADGAAVGPYAAVTEQVAGGAVPAEAPVAAAAPAPEAPPATGQDAATEPVPEPAAEGGEQTENVAGEPGKGAEDGEPVENVAGDPEKPPVDDANEEDEDEDKEDDDDDEDEKDDEEDKDGEEKDDEKS
jgi:segregation and condensation protein B